MHNKYLGNDLIEKSRIAIRVNNSAENAILHNHPWVYSDSIISQNITGKPGQLAVVFNQKRRFLAIGLYDPFSVIRVRLLAFAKQTPISKNWFQNKILESYARRDSIPQNTTGYRIVHGENDGLPGLVIDRYEDIVVLKIYTVAWVPYLNYVLSSLFKVHNWSLVVVRIARDIQSLTKKLFHLSDGDILYENNPTYPLLFKENDLIFEVDPFLGHKTGFYLDQRENRSLTENLSKGRSVLNLFAYTGAFSLYSARGGAKKITSVDISRPALDAARRNFNHNLNNINIKNSVHEMIAENVFTFLAQSKRSSYDLIIVDPPSFASKKTHISKSIKAYKQLTKMSLSRLSKGGILVQSSCSSKITSDVFFAAVHETIMESKHHFHDINKTFHPLDHPIGFKEGAYLKTIFTKID